MHTKALHPRQASQKLDTVDHGIRTAEEVFGMKYGNYCLGLVGQNLVFS